MLLGKQSRGTIDASWSRLTNRLSTDQRRKRAAKRSILASPAVYGACSAAPPQLRFTGALFRVRMASQFPAPWAATLSSSLALNIARVKVNIANADVNGQICDSNLRDMHKRGFCRIWPAIWMLAPSSVARVIDRTEARLGVRLLLRTRRSLTLTPEGTAYLSVARRILAHLRETEQSIVDQNAPRGRLRVSISQLYGTMFVMPLLRDFIQRHRDIMLEIISSDAIVDIAAGHADVAVRLGPLPDSSLTARKLAETHKVMIAAPDYLARRGAPTIPEDLHDHDCIGFNFKRAAPSWPFRKEGRDYSLRVKGSVEANNGETQGQFALAGIGIARVCVETVAKTIKAGRLVPLLEEFNPGDGEEVHAVFVGGAHTPARVRCFVDFLVERLSVSGRETTV